MREVENFKFRFQFFIENSRTHKRLYVHPRMIYIVSIQGEMYIISSQLHTVN